MEIKSTNFTPELWGGIECSFNRVGEAFRDQLRYSGHYNRGIHDLKAFATLGLGAIRYPIIWERHQPSRGQAIDWTWADQQLGGLRDLHIDPIVGLMHHGNGPAFTDLLHRDFASHFAAYAREVAERFPWINVYTPINEPLTTARFGGLYGIWYPHKRSGKMFARMFFNQMKATVLAMKNIRMINPAAKLLQTEDLSKTYSTKLLQYQADFENHRRWLTWDIICGKLDRDHPLWDYFRWLKIPQADLEFFLEHPCPPNIIGADHYLTSERFLDQHVGHYPECYHGGNGRHRYADVEAIRVVHSHEHGLNILLKECWDRYEIPIAITEVHLNGPAEERVQWFKYVWDIARKLCDRGIDIRAVTSWALLGSYGWNTLLTTDDGHYEAGAFDLSSGSVKETEFSAFLKALSVNATKDYALAPGWWQKDERFFYSAEERCAPRQELDRVMPHEVFFPS